MIDGVRAVNPELTVYSQRLGTFKNYPSDISVDTSKLCAAGLYYEGTGDMVKCYWCGGLLEEWLKDDDPWVEHAKYICAFSCEINVLLSLVRPRCY